MGRTKKFLTQVCYRNVKYIYIHLANNTIKQQATMTTEILGFITRNMTAEQLPVFKNIIQPTVTLVVPTRIYCVKTEFEVHLQKQIYLYQNSYTSKELTHISISLTLFIFIKASKNRKNNHPIINDGPKIINSSIILARLHMLYVYRSSARSNSALTCIFKSDVFCRNCTRMTCTRYR